MEHYQLLIISNSNFEDSTNTVCDWLIKFNFNFIRLNVDELFNSDYYEININLSSNNIDIYDVRRKERILLNEITTIWCRRFVYSFSANYHLGDVIYSNSMEYARFISSEINKFLKVIFDFYPKIKWLDNYKKILEIDKIDVLKKAKKVGLKIPETIICNHVINLDSNSDMITKPIGEATSFLEDEKDSGLYVTHTQSIKAFSKKKIIPSLFQQRIEKKYEIRAFYLDGDFYTMAILSCNNKKTRIDFRKYDYHFPNRNLPCDLPLKLKKQISRLMKLVKLTNGSIDLILDNNNNYYFLEINPVGQFSMVSYPCNYYIEKKIALWLINSTKSL